MGTVAVNEGVDEKELAVTDWLTAVPPFTKLRYAFHC
jgi:hypothetical protein